MPATSSVPLGRPCDGFVVNISAVERERHAIVERPAVIGIEFHIVGRGNQGPIIAQVDQITRRVLNDVPFAFCNRGIVLPFQIDIHTIVFADVGDRGFNFRTTLSSGRRDTIFSRYADSGILIFQDEIHHALIGAIAIAQRQFFRKHLDRADGFGRKIADFAETGSALAVDQNNRPPAAASPAGCGLGRNRFKQFLNRRGAIASDIRFAQFDNGRYFGDDGAARK